MAKKIERRSPGDGSIYEEKDKNGKVTFTAVHRKTINKKLIKSVKKGFTKRADAEKWLVLNKEDFDIKCAIEAGEISPTELIAEKITLNEMIDVYKNSQKYKNITKESQRIYSAYIQKFKDKHPEICKKKLKYLNAQMCQQLVDDAADNPASRKRVKTTLSAIITLAQERDLFQKVNPVKFVKIGDIIPKKKKIFSAEDEADIIAFLQGLKTIPLLEEVRRGRKTPMEHYKLAAAFTLIMIHTGARPSEIWDADPKNIDLDARVMRNTGKKTKASRQSNILFSTFIAPYVKEYMTPVNQFQTIGRRQILDVCSRLYDLLGMPDLVPYSARGTMASRLVYEDINAPMLKTVMRHVSTDTTMKYYVTQKDILAQQWMERADESSKALIQKKLASYLVPEEGEIREDGDSQLVHEYKEKNNYK